MGTHERDARTPTSELPTQSRQLGKYELIAEIGMGGMAAVYLARLVGPMNFEKVVVVKTIHPHLAREEEFIHMLLDEARISALIKHPNVVDIYDLGMANGTYFIAMEYLAGQPLSQLLKYGKRGKTLDPYTAATVIQQAAGGLHAAHKLTTMSGEHLELIHRDVSPGNLMVLYDGTVKVLDFGVSKARGRITASETGQLKGKIGYVAPEQVAGDVEIDARVDVYSLGVVMWELLTYRRLFYNDSQAATLKQISEGDVSPPSRFRADIPKPLEDICLKAMALRPDDRFQSAEAFRRAIVDALRTADYDVHGMPAYMKETFAPQRAARARLLSDVAGADAAAVEVALDEVDLELPDYVPEGTPVSRRAGRAAQLDKLAGAANIKTGDQEPSVAASSTFLPGVAPGEPRTDTELAVSRAPSRARIAFWLAAGVALGALVVVLILSIAGGDDAEDRREGPAMAADAPADASGARSGDDAAPMPPSGGDSPSEHGRAGEGADAVAVVPDPSSPSDSGEARTAGAGDDAQDDAPDEAPDDAASVIDTRSHAPAATIGEGASRRRRARRAAAEAPKLYREGVRLYVAGKAGKARTMFRRALEADSDYAPAFRGLGLVYERLGRKDKAVQWLRRYVRAVPKAKDAREIRARIRRLGG